MDQMFEILQNFPQQCKKALKLGKNLTKPKRKINRVLVSGMGGSGIVGDLTKSYVDNIPVFVNKTHDIPNFVGKNTLSFIISYSGKTEETLSSYKKSLEKKAHVIVVSSSSKLEKKCKNYIKIPEGYPPRGAIGYLFLSVVNALDTLGIKKKPSVKSLLKLLKKVKKQKQKAKEIAEKYQDKIPLIYAYETFYPTAYRFKCQMNEIAKSHAFFNFFPELDHNELNVYMTKPNNQFYCIIFRDPNETNQIKKRMDVTKKLINLPIEEYKIEGQNRLEKLISTIYFWDWVSYYYAKQSNKDPMNTEIMEKLKEKLK